MTRTTKKGLDNAHPRCHHGTNAAEETLERSAVPVGAKGIYDKRIWRVKDVAKFLGCSVGHVYNLASDEKIPKRKKNGLLVFVPEEIHSWILEGDER